MQRHYHDISTGTSTRRTYFSCLCNVSLVRKKTTNLKCHSDGTSGPLWDWSIEHIAETFQLVHKWYWRFSDVKATYYLVSLIIILGIWSFWYAFLIIFWFTKNENCSEHFHYLLSDLLWSVGNQGSLNFKMLTFEISFV